MQHGLVIFDLLFPLVQDPTKAIHPAMSPIDDLTMGFETLESLITGLDIRLVAAAQPACLVIFVGSESEFLSRTTRLEGFECIRIRCCDDQRKRKPVGICHQTAL